MAVSEFETKLARRFLWLPVAFFAPMVGLHLVLKFLRQSTWFIMHPFWPLSVFSPMLPVLIDVVTVAAIAGLTYLLWLVREEKRWFLLKMSLIVGVIALASNLLQGFEYGWVQPIVGRGDAGQSYWLDSQYVSGIREYMETYTLYQPTMGYHARVHPPGAVLWFWLSSQLSTSPLFAGLLILSVSLGTLAVVYFWARVYVNEVYARYVAMLLGVMPAFQIYAYASLDGVIAFFFTATLWVFAGFKRWWQLAIAIVLFYVAAMLTFGVLWLLPVIGYISWYIHKKWQTSVYLGLGVLGMLALTYVATGYSYLESFEVAHSFENTGDGWYGLADTPSYIVTRIQDVLEPMVFMGPYVVYMLMVSLWRYRLKQDLTGVGWAGIGAFLIFILAGAYYTGETARAALYLLPVMILALTPLLNKAALSEKMQRNILVAVIVQTVVMQMLGYYSW